MATPDPRYLSGLPVKKRILAEVAEAIGALSGAAPLPRLVSISIGDTPEVAVYIRGQKRAAEQVGLPFDDQYWPGDITAEDAKARLVAMNDDPERAGRYPAASGARALERPLPPRRDPPAEGCRGHEPGVDR